MLGIVSLLCCGIVTGIIALVLGYLARNEIKASGGAVGGDGMALAGMITGGIGIVLSIIWIPIYLGNIGN